MKNSGGKYVSTGGDIFRNLTVEEKMSLYDSLPREFRDVLKNHVVNVVPAVQNVNSIEEAKEAFQKMDNTILNSYKNNVKRRIIMSSKATYGEDYPYEWSPW